MINKIKTWFAGLDKELLSAVLALMLVGVLFAGVVPTYIRIGLDTNIFLDKSVTSFVLAAIVLLVTSTMSVKWVKRTCLILGAVALLLLIPTIIMPHIIKGSARYASIAGYNIYPALLLLPAFVVVLSNLLTRSATDGSWKVYFKYLAFFLSFCCIMMIVLLHPDTGMFVFCNCLLLLDLFICGRHDKKAMSLFWIIFAIFASLMIFTFFTMPHVHHRIMNFFTGQGDIFQVSMAKKAMLNASLVGGSVKSIMFIPDGHTDFALASIVGYFGYIFTAFLLTVFWFVARKVLQHAKQAKDLFTKNFMTIVACMFIFQTLLHISVNLGLVPTFSTALPLVSFGGTSKLVYALLFGSVLALTRHQESEPVKVKRVVKKKK